MSIIIHMVRITLTAGPMTVLADELYLTVLKANQQLYRNLGIQGGAAWSSLNLERDSRGEKLEQSHRPVFSSYYYQGNA